MDAHGSKIKVFVGHKQIGWLRELTVKKGLDERLETVVTPALSKATTYQPMEAGYAMVGFQGPDREPGTKPQAPVTFQLCRV